MSIIDDNHKWGGNDPVLLAEAFRELNNSSRSSGHRATSPVAVRPRRMSESQQRKSPEPRQRRMSLEGGEMKKDLPHSRRTRLMSDSDIAATTPANIGTANNVGWESGMRRTLLSPVPSA
ncbi:hypothetical protein GUITHDRAFT_153662 [Guillardia theta CCMP2712]|uniref:Uncharacterized protein n=1 Tax=Guillardia theta (strain CCMP2712) TaxID=905079 RepID=L1J0R7_GUITC|nr:hypothetical protein GUITHDRAFT_153662 [Guillardia theta CCMP2712]EKX42106.1 hypothetical protein GUITHDRAFT_153662 [Guillardia theta CCMP2712]|eukprot:XP_005829086.1 hypothetical protein GUITHDRAFT_153662 [Guillardia theta CCMP2712]